MFIGFQFTPFPVLSPAPDQMAQVGTIVSSIFGGQAGTRLTWPGSHAWPSISGIPSFAGCAASSSASIADHRPARGAQNSRNRRTLLLQSHLAGLGFTYDVFLLAFLLPPFSMTWASDAPVRYIAWEYTLKALAPGLLYLPGRRCATSSAYGLRPTFPWPS